MPLRALSPPNATLWATELAVVDTHRRESCHAMSGEQIWELSSVYLEDLEMVLFSLLDSDFSDLLGEQNLSDRPSQAAPTWPRETRYGSNMSKETSAAYLW